MIRSIKINNLGPISKVECSDLGGVNLLIGKNGIGKTQMVKALYAAINATEQFKRGIEHRGLSQLLTDKLYRTFLPRKIGDLVKKGESELSFSMKNEKDESFDFAFGKDTVSQIQNIKSNFSPVDTNSIFIPAKEIISLQSLIIESRSPKFNLFGFDDTYLDLALALTPVYAEKGNNEFSEVRQLLNGAIGGHVEFNDERKEWLFKDTSRREYGIALASEGIKKMSVLDVLLGNYYLSSQSVVIIDEFEAALHPQLIANFAEFVMLLAQKGIQFFITTHSYAAIKKFYILAHKYDVKLPLLSFEADRIMQGDLRNGMPDNSIIRESINLYMEELEL